jgi:polar amino acid transport system substrate-binding protein
VSSLRKIIILIVFITSQNTFANETITLAAENSWPPYSDKSGNGISKDIIQAAYNAINVNVEFITVPYARALKMTENGQVDGVFNVTKQKSTIEIFNFGKVPILQAVSSFYYHNDSELNFSSINEIPKEIAIGVIIGYEYGDHYEIYKSQLKEVKVANQLQLIGLLLNKRIDMAIMFDDVVKIKLQEMGLEFNSIKKGKINHISDIYVAFSKAKDTSNAMNLLDEGLKVIKNTAD